VRQAGGHQCPLSLVPAPRRLLLVGEGAGIVTQIESIGCRLAQGDDSLLTWFVVTDSDGIEEHREGTLLDASELAAAHGLALVPTLGGWFKWVRDAGTFWVPHS
jgi:hypothetical protein